MRAIESELTAYSPGLAARPRWLVLNKMDLLDPVERDSLTARLKSALDLDHEPFFISAVTGDGTRPLVEAVSDTLLELDLSAQEDAEEAARQRALADAIDGEVLAHAIARIAPEDAAAKHAESDGAGSDDEGEDDGVEVVYVP